MRSRTPLIFVIILLLGLVACSKPIPPRPEAIKQAQPEFTTPEIDHWTEDNGLEVYLLEDHELPLVSGEFYFKFGSLTDALERTGESSALMSQIRAGGFKGNTPQQLEAELDAVGASIEGSAGGEFSNLSFFFHTKRTLI